MLEFKGITQETDKQIPEPHTEILIQQVHYFPITVVINYYKCSGLNNTKLSYSSVGQKFNTDLNWVKKSRCLVGLYSALEEILLPCPFWFLEVAHILGFRAPSSVFEANNTAFLCACLLQSYFPQTDSPLLSAILLF